MRLFKTTEKAEWGYDNGFITRIVAEGNKLTIYFSYDPSKEVISRTALFARELDTYVVYYTIYGNPIVRRTVKNKLEKFDGPIPAQYFLARNLYMVGSHAPGTKSEFHSTGLFSKTPHEMRIDHIHICTKNKTFTTEELNLIFRIANAYQETTGKFSEVRQTYTV